MARISTYSKDLIITRQDKVIGSDATGSVTKNYTLEGIGKFLSENGLITIGGQSMYQYALIRGEKKFTNQSGSNAFADLTSLEFSEVDGAEHNIEDFILEYAGARIVLMQNDDKNNYGIYKVSGVIEDSSNLNFYDFTLEHVSSNGSLILDKYYALSFLGQGDKHAEIEVATPSTEWVLQHNLNKFPSVTVVLSTGQKGYGNVTYQNNNRLTVHFTAAESGKAYMN